MSRSLQKSEVKISEGVHHSPEHKPGRDFSRPHETKEAHKSDYELPTSHEKHKLEHENVKYEQEHKDSHVDKKRKYETVDNNKEHHSISQFLKFDAPPSYESLYPHDTPHNHDTHDDPPSYESLYPHETYHNHDTHDAPPSYDEVVKHKHGENDHSKKDEHDESRIAKLFHNCGLD